MARALEPRYGTNAPSRHADVLPARLAMNGSLANGPVGRPLRIGSRVAPGRGCRPCDKLSPSHSSKGHMPTDSTFTQSRGGACTGIFSFQLMGPSWRSVQ